MNRGPSLPFPKLLPLPCLDVVDAQITQQELDTIKTNVQLISSRIRQKQQQSDTHVYDLQNSRLFCNNRRDIMHLIRQIEIELKGPRNEQMTAFSFALIWLYREQISLLREPGELDANERRSHPKARGIRTRSEDMEKGLASTG
jgi:hypothetical protein